ncbi:MULTISPECIES: M61 family metallopeptidase [unclassified Pseudoalteromonas]|uniref:M61 family metallopeptidase n=1 Tax=unclassified Pseudoalteromonas TaxID=194690 RepID=UPI003014E983
MKKSFLSLLGMIALNAYATVEYKVSFEQPEHHLANVEMTFPKTSQASLDIKLPDWRTGRYEILDLANGIRFFSASTDDNEPLQWQKIDKNTWRVHLKEPTKVHVQYQVYANELGLRARHVDDSHAFIDASGFFMFSDAFRSEPVTVELAVPSGWRSVSGMQYGDTKHSFKAENYDILLDSPIETGINQLHQFSVDDRDYELVIWGEGNYDVEMMISDLKKLVQTGSLIWHQYPYQRYVFMVHATSGARGATEHLNSTIIQRHRDSFKEREDYVGFIATAAHEFIHTWNVKNYRPAGLVPYDYVAPNYTDLLWLAEGSTSYFEDYLLLSAGITSNDEYLDMLTKRINRHLETPGRTVQSVAHSSFDKWINQGGDHGHNFSTNIYSEGALVSMALDLDLLIHSEGKVSYRDVHRELYKQHKLPNSFTSEDVKAILKQLSGRDYSDWWQQYVDSPAKIDFAGLLQKVGLNFAYPEDSQVVAGFDGKASKLGELLQLQRVAKDGNAWQAGLTAGDQIVSFDRHHVRETLAASLQHFNPGQEVTVHFIRRDKLMTTELTLATKYDKPRKVTPVTTPTASQQRLYQAWMGVAHPHASK